MKELSRRNYFKKSVLSVGSLLLAAKGVRANSCQLTPDQTEGPFYPIEDQIDKDSNLTRLTGSQKQAKGQVIIMAGVVSDENCRPVENALVEIWQACETGKYNHPSDPNPAQLDPDFQYWGRSVTNSRGEYSFKTIRPGHYRATSSWIRPAHIHLKVHRRGYEELTTQVYFKDDPYNSNDRILNSLTKVEQRNVIVDFKSSERDGIRLDETLKRGEFNITIRGI